MGQLLGTIFGPIGSLFHYVFYEPVYNLLMLLYHVTNSFALSIVLLTVTLRLCLLPLTRKQLQSSRKMQELQPQIKALQTQYRGDPQGLMAAQRQLFKDNNYSQAQGCLPLLIQMPVLYSLFYAFRTVIGNTVNGHPPTVAQHLSQINTDIYPFLPHVVHILPTQFLWVDLAQPDPIHLLPLLAAVLTFIQLRMAVPVRPKPLPGAAPDATAQASKMTMYLMPVITFVFGLNFPAGMALYWSVGTMFMVVQQYFLSGLGSLFVGIPGMEHLVPEPKPTVQAPVPTGRNGARPGTYSASAARSALIETPSARTRTTATPATPSPITSPVSGGIIGRLREQWAAVQRQAQEAAAARGQPLATTNGKIVDSTASVDADEDDAEQSVELAQSEASASARTQQRVRPAKQAPQLVKPSHTPPIDARPAALPRVATNGNGTTKPLQAAANGSNGSNGSNNGKAGSGANGSTAANGAVSVRRVTNGAPSSTRPLNGGQRKGSSGAKGTATTRTRPTGSANGAGSVGRPKGGR